MARQFENELNSSINFKPVYKTQYEDDDLNEDSNLKFDLELFYSLPGNNPDVRIAHQTIEFDKDWLACGDKGKILENIYLLLDQIHIPCYKSIVEKLHQHILDLKKNEANPLSPKVKRVEVRIQVTVTNFPYDEVVYTNMAGMDVDVDVDEDEQIEVPPASDEAMENHLKTVVAENDKECAICLDTIQSGPEAAAVQMPCMHVFHRTCVHNWLRTSGTCPKCRDVFPS